MERDCVIPQGGLKWRRRDGKKSYAVTAEEEEEEMDEWKIVPSLDSTCDFENETGERRGESSLLTFAFQF